MKCGEHLPRDVEGFGTFFIGSQVLLGKVFYAGVFEFFDGFFGETGAVNCDRATTLCCAIFTLIRVVEHYIVGGKFIDEIFDIGVNWDWHEKHHGDGQ